MTNKHIFAFQMDGAVGVSGMFFRSFAHMIAEKMPSLGFSQESCATVATSISVVLSEIKTIRDTLARETESPKESVPGGAQNARNAWKNYGKAGHLTVVK